jgi:membrane protease YdiL (CAAX protease family)
MLGHGHFYRADPLVLSVLLTAIYGAVIWAWVTWRTGSIIPAVVAHGLGNIPLPLTQPWLAPLVLVMAFTVAWRRRTPLAAIGWLPALRRREEGTSPGRTGFEQEPSGLYD